MFRVKDRMAESNLALPTEKDGSKDIGDAMWKAKLSPIQYAILRQKGTDRPHTGEYDEFFGEGEYHCAACDSLLYTSEMKFDCGCGWPGFWTNVKKAVREEPDADGRRVEILCNACNGHLGHVFRGEGFPNPLNERHCVNSTSLRFLAKAVPRI
jgi:peptide-methionine (R)-S-oxide reductase